MEILKVASNYDVVLASSKLKIAGCQTRNICNAKRGIRFLSATWSGQLALALARGADSFTWAIRRQAPTASHVPAASRAQYQRIGRIQGNMRETREELCCLFGEFVKHT